MAEEIVAKLIRATDSYYNSGETIMSDDAYDALKEQLEELAPNHPFLKKVGASVKEGSIRLPVPMASLNKIKPGTGSVENFARSAKNGFVLSDKLDGISALWIPKGAHMYLRGDGAVGQNVSAVAKLGIQGLPIHLEPGFMVRGELVLTRKMTPTNAIGRSLVNGFLHQSAPSREDIQKIRFVAYEIVSDKKHTRMEQLQILKKKGYEVPWWLHLNQISDAILAEHLLTRRRDGMYDIDGIVVGLEKIPEWHSGDNSVTNPKDCVAFKMVLADQCADTIVKAVHWNISYQGYYTPRLEIEPVRVGGAVITFVTGHNAQLIVEKKIGVGARIRIRRSGDVIPTIDAVLQGVETVVLPPAGTWRWNGPHIVSTADVESDAIIESKLKQFATTLGVDGLGPGLIKKLVAGDIKTPRALCAASAANLSEILGSKTGVNIAAGLVKGMAAADEMTLMIASSTMPRGVGETKLKVLFALESDPRKWVNTITAADGWSVDALQTFIASLSTYFKWRESQFPARVWKLTAVAAAPVVEQKGSVCFTGFRSTTLETLLLAKGIHVSSTVTKKLIALVIPDDGEHTGTKIEKARELGVRIWRKSEFMREYSIVC